MNVGFNTANNNSRRVTFFENCCHVSMQLPLNTLIDQRLSIFSAEYNVITMGTLFSLRCYYALSELKICCTLTQGAALGFPM